MLVINTTAQKKEVKIKTPAGSDIVHIQPKGRVTLTKDQSVDSNWMALNGKGIKIINTDSKLSISSASTNDSE